MAGSAIDGEQVKGPVMTTEKSASAQPATATAPAGAATIQPRRRGWLTFLRDILVIVLIAVVVSLLVKTFLVRSFYIPSGSMESTLHVNDRILVDEITPRFSEYERGDIVVFRDPGGWLPPSTAPARPPFVEGVEWVLSLVGLAAPDSDDHLVKRIIGLPGDHVECCNAIGQITVNGVPIDERAYIQTPPGESAASADSFDVVVPEGSLWVLGDNRYRSKDSRYNQEQPGKGFVPIDNVVGRAFLVTWPLDRFGTLDFHHDVFAGVPDEADATLGAPDEDEPDEGDAGSVTAEAVEELEGASP